MNSNKMIWLALSLLMASFAHGALQFVDGVAATFGHKVITYSEITLQMQLDHKKGPHAFTQSLRKILQRHLSTDPKADKKSLPFISQASVDAAFADLVQKWGSKENLLRFLQPLKIKEEQIRAELHQDLIAQQMGEIPLSVIDEAQKQAPKPFQYNKIAIRVFLPSQALLGNG